jgi:hypothetical protein
MGSWDLEKILLAFLGVLIVAGLGVGFWQRSEASRLEAGLPTAERQLAEIGRRFNEIELLKRDLQEDKVAGGNQRPAPYFEEQMRQNRMSPSDFRIDPRPPSPGAGFVDTVWEFKPQDTNRDFQRQELATFMLYVERDANTIKVSRIVLEESRRRGSGDDDWTARIEFTHREADSEL